MLDIVHYLFESDAIADKETQDAKTKLRRVVYSQLYERSYTWGTDEGERQFGTQEVASGGFYNAGGRGLTHKPYVPPTPVNPNSPKPFGNVLDAPLG